MIRNYINIIILFISIIFLSFLLGFYSINKNLLDFNRIILKGNNNISSDLFFEEINYKIDSINFYDKEKMNLFLSKIKDFENYDIIENINISYSLPNNMIININEKIPIYLIDNGINKFALDNKGQIFNVNFISNDIPKVDLNFRIFQVYNKSKGIIELRDLIQSIKNNKLNNKYLLNGLEILTWLSNVEFSNKIKSLSIDDHEIHIDFKKTKIIFNRDNLRNQFLKLEKIINNQKLLDNLKINQISDLREINLCFNNQIILKR